MLDEMDSVIYQMWLLYLREQPFGEMREDARHGIRAAMFGNANRRKGAKAFQPKDFVPSFGEPKESPRMSPDQTVEFLIQQLGAKHGVIDNRPKARERGD